MAKNEDVIKSAYAAFANGDIPGLLDLLADDVEWSSPTTLPHGGQFHGKDGALKFFEGIGGVWESLTVTPDSVGGAGPDLVLSVVSASGTRRAGGPASYGAMHAFVVRDGKVTNFREFVDLDAPLSP
jgi:ketosteroid isomerase-like protein